MAVTETVRRSELLHLTPREYPAGNTNVKKALEPVASGADTSRDRSRLGEQPQLRRQTQAELVSSDERPIKQLIARAVYRVLKSNRGPATNQGKPNGQKNQSPKLIVGELAGKPFPVADRLHGAGKNGHSLRNSYYLKGFWWISARRRSVWSNSSRAPQTAQKP